MGSGGETSKGPLPGPPAPPTHRKQAALLCSCTVHAFHVLQLHRAGFRACFSAQLTAQLKAGLGCVADDTANVQHLEQCLARSRRAYTLGYTNAHAMPVHINTTHTALNILCFCV